MATVRQLGGPDDSPSIDILGDTHFIPTSSTKIEPGDYPANLSTRLAATEGRSLEEIAFNSDGSIAQTLASGATVTTTFLPDGSIQQVYGAPVSQTWVTTFGVDGSVTRSQAV